MALGRPVEAVIDEGDEIARAVDRHYPHTQSTEANEGTDDLTGEERAQTEAAKLLSDADRDLLRINESFGAQLASTPRCTGIEQDGQRHQRQGHQGDQAGPSEEAAVPGQHPRAGG